MTNPTYDNIFALFYTLYRGESVVPASTDDEYTIGKRFANEAVSHWSTYDDTYWKQLFDTNLVDASGDTVIVLGQTAYNAPSNMLEAGGFVKIKDTSGNTVRSYQIIDPQDAQFRSDMSPYCYFTGDPGNGFVLNINGAPDSSIDGLSIDYVYYKKPSDFTSGSSVTECPDAEYIAHRMLAMRFRVSRNPYYQDAMRDAEGQLKIMKMSNDSGSWANPWSVPDRSGAQFGNSSGSRSNIF